jgi:hypothetical protein
MTTQETGRVAIVPGEEKGVFTRFMEWLTAPLVGMFAADTEAAFEDDEK